MLSFSGPLTHRIALIGLLSSSALLAGCFTPQAFLDPAAPKLSYDDLRKPAAPLKLIVKTQFERNGQALPAGDPHLRATTLKTLRGSGVIEPVESNAEGEISVKVNNIVALGEAVGKGIGTGLTFGLAGSTVTERYEMDVKIETRAGRYSRSKEPGHFLATVGNASRPEGVEVMPAGTAFERTVEQLLLKVLKDFDPKTSLTSVGYHRRLTLLISDPTTMSLGQHVGPLPAIVAASQSDSAASPR